MGEAIRTAPDDVQGDADETELYEGFDDPNAEMIPEDYKEPLDTEEPEKKGEEETEPEKGAEKEPTDKGSTEDEPEIEIPTRDGKSTRKVKVSDVLGWEAGGMMEADYRKKTSALNRQIEQLETVYGPLDQQGLEATAEATPDLSGQPVEEEFDPYNRNQLETTVQTAVNKALTVQSKETQEKNRDVEFERIRNDNWGQLTDQYPALANQDSDLFKTADAILKADVGLRHSPYCDVYAVERALKILNPIIKENEKAEGRQEIITRLGENETQPSPTGGGDSDTEEVLTAEEEKLVKIPPHEAGFLPDKQFQAYLKANEKLARIGRG